MCINKLSLLPPLFFFKFKDLLSFQLKRVAKKHSISHVFVDEFSSSIRIIIYIFLGISNVPISLILFVQRKYEFKRDFDFESYVLYLDLGKK